MGYIGPDGKYHKQDVRMADVVPEKAVGWKQSDHDQQRADYKADLVKPYLADGTPNPEFIELYPLESQEIYKFIKSDEDIAREHK